MWSLCFFLDSICHLSSVNCCARINPLQFVHSRDTSYHLRWKITWRWIVRLTADAVDALFGIFSIFSRFFIEVTLLRTLLDITRILLHIFSIFIHFWLNALCWIVKIILRTPHFLRQVDLITLIVGKSCSLWKIVLSLSHYKIKVIYTGVREWIVTILQFIWQISLVYF